MRVSTEHPPGSVLEMVLVKNISFQSYSLLSIFCYLPQEERMLQAKFPSALPWLYPSCSNAALMQKDLSVPSENLNFPPRKIPGISSTQFGFPLRTA